MVAHARSRAQPTLSNPQELFTCVPSRSFFPRGFLWDEGFHLLVILEWDLDLAIEIVRSWLSLMDEDGWIAREQILGPEARSKVPPEFQVQYPNYANPSTMFLAVDAIADRLFNAVVYFGRKSRYMEDRAASQDLLDYMYSKLKLHCNWFQTTQGGNLALYKNTDFRLQGYRWRGRTPQHTLTSGLDDYPRAQPPHPGELHVDALGWVGVMVTVLAKLAQFSDQTSIDSASFNKQREEVIESLNTFHWSDSSQTYCDTTIEHDEPVHVCHQGYASLMPFLVGLLDAQDPKLQYILELMRDEDQLWSAHGLRSLSKRDEFYGKDENYWRGPIWININYLALQRLLVRSIGRSKFDYANSATRS
jgi:mannosyl-oligosaccharide glucosidase